MKIERTLSPALNTLQPSEAVKIKIIDTAKKIINFIDFHKTTIFFAATVLFTMAVTANPLLGMPVKEIVVSGILSGAALHGLGVLFGSKTLMEKESQDKIDVALGVINLCSWYLNPAAGVATSIFNTGAQLCSFAFTRLFEEKKAVILIV